MTAIKGQNLRVFIDNEPIARAQSCTVHIAADVQDISSKDSVDGWQENVVTGFSWDVSVDAMVLPNAAELMDNGEFTSVTSTDEMEIDGETTVYISNYVIAVPAGETIVACAPGNASNYVYIIEIETADSFASATNRQNASYTNTGTAAVEVYLGCSADEQSIRYTIGEANSAATLDTLIPEMFVDTDVSIEFSLTDGVMNRNQDSVLLSGNGRITDMSVNAANRQLATYTCQIVGNGELSMT